MNLRHAQRRRTDTIRSRVVGALVLAVLAAAGGAVTGGPPAAAAPPPPARSGTVAAGSADKLVAGRPAELFSTAGETFVRRRAGSAGGTQYVPYERTHHGLPVIGGDFVVAVDASGRTEIVSSALRRPIGHLDPKPVLSQAAAEQAAATQPRSVAKAGGSRLVVFAATGDPRLAWEVTVDGNLAVTVDARTGAVLDRREQDSYDTGIGSYNGPGPLTVPSVRTIFYDAGNQPHWRWILEDHARAPLSCNPGILMRIDPVGTPVWGNGYATDIETACVDAVYGAEIMVTMMSQWLGRNGMDGDGNGFVMTVGLDEENARYHRSSSSEGIEFGHDRDGRWLTTPDIVGHENGHGVDSHTPGGMSGGGTKEFIADTFGTATEWFAGNSAPFDTPDYVLGDRNTIGWQREMAAAACFTTATPDLEVHDAAAPGNHWFYLLAEGANPTNGQPSSPTCDGSNPTGIGIGDTMRILYSAMLMKNSNSSYPAYRTWTLTAAKNLFPANCTMFTKVKSAWDAVSVPAQSAEPTCTTRVAVPNLIGATRAQASAALGAAGLAVGRITTDTDYTCNFNNQVMSSSPPAGTFLDAGSPVSLEIGTRPKAPYNCN